MNERRNVKRKTQKSKTQKTLETSKQPSKNLV